MQLGENLAVIDPTLNTIMTLADDHLPSSMFKDVLNELTGHMAGNKDNLIYYRLDAVRQWIERRLGSQHDGELQQLRDDVTAARDAINGLEHGVRRGVTAIQKEIPKRNPDLERVRRIASETMKSSDENKNQLFSRLMAAHQGLDQLQQTLRQE